jgi:hypothetical protein
MRTAAVLIVSFLIAAASRAGEVNPPPKPADNEFAEELKKMRREMEENRKAFQNEMDKQQQTRKEMEKEMDEWRKKQQEQMPRPARPGADAPPAPLLGADIDPKMFEMLEQLTRENAPGRGAGVLDRDLMIPFDDLRGFLGVNVDDAAGGAKVTDVIEGSPAEAAGLMKDDVVTRIGQTAVRSAADFTSEVRRRKPDEQVTLAFRRANETKEAVARLARRNDVVIDPSDPAVRVRIEAGDREVVVTVRSSQLAVSRADAWRALQDRARQEAVFKALAPVRREARAGLRLLAQKMIDDKKNGIDPDAMDKWIDDVAQKTDAVLKQRLSADEFAARQKRLLDENSLGIEIVRLNRDKPKALPAPASPAVPAGDAMIF